VKVFVFKDNKGLKHAKGTCKVEFDAFLSELILYKPGRGVLLQGKRTRLPSGIGAGVSASAFYLYVRGADWIIC